VKRSLVDSISKMSCMKNQPKGSIKSVQKCACIFGGFLPDIITNRDAEDVECLPLH
jgi:hypothetical protein